MTDRDALLRAICLVPGDTVRRLAYADWLYEFGGEADAAYADFIVAQCENAPDAEGLQVRYFAGQFLRGLGPLADFVTFDQVERGFVGSVSLTATQLLGGPCDEETCDGGYVAWLEDSRRCPTCGGTAQVTGKAEATFSFHPVTRVSVLGREPFAGGTKFSWYHPGRSTHVHLGQPHALPAELFEEVRTLVGTRCRASYDHVGYILLFDTSGEARDALSRAAVNCGRLRAGLPRLYPAR